MVDDLIWRQFLLFCLRHGLWYSSDPTQDDGAQRLFRELESCRVVTSYSGNILNQMQSALVNPRNGEKELPDKQGLGGSDTLEVVVSSLERSFR